MPAILTRGDEGTLELDLSACRGYEFKDALARIRDVPGRRYNGDRKVWVVPDDVNVVERILKTIRPQADESIHEWVLSSKIQEEADLVTRLPDDATDLLLPWATERQPWQPEEVNDDAFTGLLPWQRAAVAHMAEVRTCILADDMGLGKTIQAIAAIEEADLRDEEAGTLEPGPRLVVCPNSVKGGWARELNRWLRNPSIHVISGTTPKARLRQLSKAVEDPAAWVIVNWEQLRVKSQKVPLRNGGERTEWVMKDPLFEQTAWRAVVADEVHRAKNRKSQQTRGLWRIQAPIMFALSGTPLMNSPDELWSILRWLWPDDYHERGRAHAPGARAYWGFYDQYVEYWEDAHRRKVVTGVKNADGLRFELKDRLLRRTAAILNLKGRKRIRYGLTLNPKQQKLYDEAEKAMWLQVEQEAAEGDESARRFLEAANDGAAPEALYRIPNGAARMVRLQQIIETPANLGGEDDSALMDDFVDKFVNSRPEQWVFACMFKESCARLVARLEKQEAQVALFTGDVSPEERTKIEDAFQRGELDAIVGTLAALKEGLTLTRGRLIGQMTRSFVPDINEQFESRCDRKGQQQQVLIYIPLAEDTVAVSKVEPINTTKEAIVRAVLPKDEIQEESL